jgi:hypothetical protein
MGEGLELTLVHVATPEFAKAPAKAGILRREHS